MYLRRRLRPLLSATLFALLAVLTQPLPAGDPGDGRTAAAMKSAAAFLNQGSRDLLTPETPETLSGFRSDGGQMTAVGGELVGTYRGGDEAGLTHYIVAPGDTLWDIARRHRLTVQTVCRANGLQSVSVIRPGQRLVLPAVDGTMYVVRRGDSLWSIARQFGVQLRTLADCNGLADPSSLRVGQRLVVPQAQPQVAVASRGGAGADGAGGGLPWPVDGRISSYFGPRWGRMHTGLDIAAPLGTVIKAAAAGEVLAAGWMGGYGRTVIIQHSRQMQTLYAHASALLVKRGQKVTAGQVIARVGSSGNSTGPHVHFEVIVDGRPRDPLNYLR